MSIYKRHRFPADIISYAVWLYHRFNLSYRDIEDLLAERGISVSRESIRLWYPKHSLRSYPIKRGRLWGRLCNKFGPRYAKRLKRKHQGFGDTFFLDEVFVKINGKHSDSWESMLPYTIYSTWVGILYQRSITEVSGQVRLAGEQK